MQTRLLLVLAALGSAAFGQGIIATFAGGTKVFPSGTLAPLSSAVVPVSVAVAPNGDLYFSDQPANSVLKLTRQGALSVVAGNGIQGFSGDGGPATSAALSGPKGVALDGAGNLFIADSNNHRVRRVAADGTISTVAGNGIGGFSGDGGPATSARLAFPWTLAMRADGTLFVGDLGNIRVRTVNPAGVIATFAGTGVQVSAGDGGPATSASFVFPQDIALDAQGNLYVADTAAHRIRRVNAAGVISTIAGNGTFGFSGDGGPATLATLALPRGLSLDTSGNLYIADSGSNRIRRVSPSGTITTIAGTGQPVFAGDGGPAAGAAVSGPLGVALDDTGQIFIADTDNRRLRRINSSGVITTLAGNGSASALQDGALATNAGLSFPGGLAVDAAGNLYIADVSNQRVRRIRPDGIISTIAGNGVSGYSGDGGPGTSARLSFPLGVATDRAGNVYIADRNNHRVRRVDPSGVITTVAGNGVGGFSGDS